MIGKRYNDDLLTYETTETPKWWKILIYIVVGKASLNLLEICFSPAVRNMTFLSIVGIVVFIAIIFVYHKMLERKVGKLIEIFRCGDFQKSIDILKRMSKNIIYKKKMKKLLAILYLNAGLYKELDELLRENIFNKYDSGYNFIKGLIFLEKKEYIQSIKYFEMVSEEEKSYSFHINLSYAYYNVKQYNNVINELLFAYEKKPQDKTILFRIATIYSEIGEIQNAVKYYKNFLSMEIDKKNELTEFAAKYV